MTTVRGCIITNVALKQQIATFIQWMEFPYQLFEKYGLLFDIRDGGDDNLVWNLNVFNIV